MTNFWISFGKIEKIENVTFSDSIKFELNKGVIRRGRIFIVKRTVIIIRIKNGYAHGPVGD